MKVERKIQTVESRTAVQMIQMLQLEKPEKMQSVKMEAVKEEAVNIMAVKMEAWKNLTGGEMSQMLQQRKHPWLVCKHLYGCLGPGQWTSSSHRYIHTKLSL